MDTREKQMTEQTRTQGSVPLYSLTTTVLTKQKITKRTHFPMSSEASAKEDRPFSSFALFWGFLGIFVINFFLHQPRYRKNWIACFPKEAHTYCQ